MVGRNTRACVCCAVGGAVILLGLGLSGRAQAGTPPARQSTQQEQTAAAAALEVVPDVIRFVDVPVGETYTQTVRLANPGKTSVRIEKISMDGRDFGVSGAVLPLMLLPGSNANVTVSYRPRVAGRINAEMRIVTSGGASPVMVEVIAAAVGSETELVASEANVHFEDVPLGGKSVKEVSLTNTGNRDVVISKISVSGNDFSVAGGNPVSLGAGQSVNLEVGFAPRDAGEKSGTLAIACEGSNSEVQIALSGAGAQASQSEIRLQWGGSPAGAQGYRVYRSAEPGGPYQRISSGTVDSPAYTDTGLAAGHTYYYVVTSLDANNQESEFSEQITATVP
jgi:hypothetical protein